MNQQIVQRRGHSLASTYRLFYDEPVVVDHAEGVWITDSEGHRLLDAYNNVPVIGHSHPRVREAVAAELGRINTHTRYVDSAIINYADRLLDRFPKHLDAVVFTCSGSEANDLALQTARHYTGRQGVIVTSHAYHGTTAAIRAISPSLSGELTDPHAETVTVNPADGDASAAATFAAEVRSAIDRLADRGIELAAILVDSSLTSDGIVSDPQGFLADGIRIATDSGALYLADEVQAGFCRLGCWWGFEQHNLAPNIVTLGKPMGNGLPVAGVVAEAEIFDAFGSRYRYFNTFAGTPAPIAAANVVLDELIDMDAAQRTQKLGVRLREGLHAAASAAGVDMAVRGSGLMVGLDLLPGTGSPDEAGQAVKRIVNRLRQRGVLVSSTGVYGEVVKIRPPLVVNADDIDFLVNRAAEVLAELRL